MWKIEKFVSKGDYVYAKVPNHPNSTKNGYVLAHRVIMENYLGRLLTDSEIVHHRDGNKKNNDLNNLELMNAIEHVKYHGRQIGKHLVKLKCPNCKKIFIKERRQTHLIKHNNSFTACSPHCRGCFSRYIQLNGHNDIVNQAIKENIVGEIVSKDYYETLSILCKENNS